MENGQVQPSRVIRMKTKHQLQAYASKYDAALQAAWRTATEASRHAAAAGHAVAAGAMNACPLGPAASVSTHAFAGATPVMFSHVQPWHCAFPPTPLSGTMAAGVSALGSLGSSCGPALNWQGDTAVLAAAMGRALASVPMSDVLQPGAASDGGSAGRGPATNYSLPDHTNSAGAHTAVAVAGSAGADARARRKELLATRRNTHDLLPAAVRSRRRPDSSRNPGGKAQPKHCRSCHNPTAGSKAGDHLPFQREGPFCKCCCALCNLPMSVHEAVCIRRV